MVRVKQDRAGGCEEKPDPEPQSWGGEGGAGQYHGGPTAQGRPRDSDDERDDDEPPSNE